MGAETIVRDEANVLVGRSDELSLLTGELAAVREGTSRFAVVSGEPGIGKTRLLAELTRAAEAEGFLSLEGAAAEFERELPFGLVIDAFDAYLQSLGPRDFERLAADGLGELASVFPSLRSLAEGSRPPATVGERFLAHNAVRELLERMAARQPLLVVLDDLHWADGASLELVVHLLRRRPQAPVLVAVAYRSGQLQGAPAAEIERAIAGGRASAIALDPLAPDEARSLLAATEGGAAEELYRASGGNPFYLLQLAGGSGPAVSVARERGDETEVPPAVAASIAAELDGLTPATRAFCEAAAVAGDPFDLDLAIAAAGVDEHGALEAVEELLARRLVRRAELPRSFRFRHPLVRHAVYERSGAKVRVPAHERIARALAERGAPVTARAHHIEHAAQPGDTEAIAVLREAGIAAGQRAPASAARWLAAALRLMAAADPARLELLALRARALSAIGRFTEARESLLEVIELLPPELGDARARAVVGCARVEHILGSYAAARGRLLAALEELPDRNSAEGAALMVALAGNALYQLDYPEIAEWGERTLAAARAAGDRPLTAAAAGISAAGSAVVGEVEQAEKRRAEAAELIDSMPDSELAVRLDATSHLAGAELYLDRFAEGEAHAERGAAVARATGQDELLPVLVPLQAAMNYMRGNLAKARELLDNVVEGARLTGAVEALAWGLFNRSFATRLAGDLDAALADAHEAAEVARDGYTGLVSLFAETSEVDPLCELGEFERAVEGLIVINGGEELPRVPYGWRPYYLARMARCRIELGQLEGARASAARASEIAERTGLPLATSSAARARAEVALADGDANAAAELALEAVAAAERAETRIDAGLARTVAGRALAAMGERERAIAELERAAAQLDECEAARYRDEAVLELRRLGRHVHRRSRAGKAGADGLEALTERELEVARLVVDRRTNAEIASELFLSLKTVESHMRNIFRKLDLSSRVDVARAIERAEIRSSDE